MYKQKSEIFKQVKSFHKHLSEFYSSLIDKAENQRVEILLNYLSRYEKLREEFLIDYEDIAPGKVMNSWVRESSNKLSGYICECFKNTKNLSSYSVDDIVKIELHFDNCLVKLYETLAVEEGTNGNDTNIFYCLMKKTKQQEMNFSRNVNGLYDF